MPISWQRLFDTEHLSFGAPLAWAIGVAAIVSAFAVIAMIANYASLNRAAEQRIETQLPPTTYEAVGALIKASGNACEQICAISAVNSLSPSNRIDVTCASAETGCRAPIRYRINVEASASPRR
jgi:hypothetical protein